MRAASKVTDSRVSLALEGLARLGETSGSLDLIKSHVPSTRVGIKEIEDKRLKRLIALLAIVLLVAIAIMVAAEAVFAVPVFFICFRECLETAIIVSVLLAFLKQTLGPDRDAATYKKLVRQIWLGTGVGLAICIVIGCGLIGAFYGLGKNAWAGTEDIWEGVFGLVSSLIISIMGVALLRVSKLQDKWRVKLARQLESKDNTRGRLEGNRFKLWCEKYAMFLLPFITVLREGLEGVIFIGGVSLGLPASSFPLAVICGLACGALIGFFIYKGGNMASIQIFLVASTCFLYLVGAGLFSKSVWLFENYQWGRIVGGDAAETGTGAGSYDIRKSVWHVNCCSPAVNGGGGWGIFNALFGWQNSATVGSVVSYNVYWVVVMIAFVAMRYNEKKGHWPLLRPKQQKAGRENSDSSSGGGSELAHPEKALAHDAVVSEVRSTKS